MKRAWNKFFLRESLDEQPPETVRLVRRAFREGYEAGIDEYCNCRNPVENVGNPKACQECGKPIRVEDQLQNQQSINTRLILRRLK